MSNDKQVSSDAAVARPTANTVIESIGVYLPPKEVSTSDIVSGVKYSLRYPLERLTGIASRRMAGDTEFASPETLVAFALGLSLFVVTLGLNVLALYIVRKYREQYE